MFTDIRTESSSNLVQVRLFLDFVQASTPAPPTPTPAPLVGARGLFFVYLYGVYEKTVRDAVCRAIQLINQKSHRILDLKPLLLSLALHPECDAISAPGGRNWQRRWDLFRKLDLNPVANLCEEVLPTDSANFRYRQLEMIWTTFCITDPVVPSPEIGGRIKELVDNRNAVAHGDSTPQEVGARVTITDLYSKYNDISGYCSYFLNVLETHIKAQAYLG